jgi:hypothetical protein
LTGGLIEGSSSCRDYDCVEGAVGVLPSLCSEAKYSSSFSDPMAELDCGPVVWDAVLESLVQ